MLDRKYLGATGRMIAPWHLEPFSTGRVKQPTFRQMSFRKIATVGWGEKALESSRYKITGPTSICSQSGSLGLSSGFYEISP